jgi:hypothetical protein
MQTSNNSSEFGNVLIYAIIYAILLHRIRTGYYTAEESKRVRAISNLMVVYPAVYVICTLPLASARMAAMTGEPPSLARLCLAGAMITSNGWLDVLLYTCTRRIMIFSDEPPADSNGFETFTAPFWQDKATRFARRPSRHFMVAKTGGMLVRMQSPLAATARRICSPWGIRILNSS